MHPLTRLLRLALGPIAQRARGFLTRPVLENLDYTREHLDRRLHGMELSLHAEGRTQAHQLAAQLAAQLAEHGAAEQLRTQALCTTLENAVLTLASVDDAPAPGRTAPFRMPDGRPYRLLLDAGDDARPLAAWPTLLPGVLPQGAVLIDAAAGAGAAAIPAALAGAGVHAFESRPGRIGQLWAAARLNDAPALRIVPGALAGEPGMQASAEGGWVLATTLDAYAAACGLATVSVIVLDMAAAGAVLDGAAGLLARDRPDLLLRPAPGQWHGVWPALPPGYRRFRPTAPDAGDAALLASARAAAPDGFTPLP